MIASAPTFPKRRVYWSELRERSPLTLVLLDHPRDSKFPDRLPYVRFRVDGDPSEHELQIESEAARFVLEKNVAVGVPTTVAATGKGENAVLEVQGAAVLPVATPAPRRATNEPPAERSIARDLFDALEAAHALVATFEQRHGREPSDAELRLTATLFIEASKSGRPLMGGAR